MSAKKKKSAAPWVFCESCNVIIPQKDSQLHTEKFCPPNFSSWAQPFVFEEKLHCILNLFQLNDKSLELIPKESRNEFVLVPCHVLQLCKIPLGDPVVVRAITENEKEVWFIKTAWPASQEKTSDFTIALSEEDALIYNFPPKSQVCISKLQEIVLPAYNVTVNCKNIDNSAILPRVAKQNLNKIFCVGNKVCFRHYGRKLLFEITEIFPNLIEENLQNVKFYLSTKETKWTLKNNKTEKEIQKNILNKVGGLDEIISELKDVMSLALKKKNLHTGFQITRGILLYGPSGTGKTLLMEALAQYFTPNIFRVECSKILSKVVGETEKELENIFEKAKETNPSVILIDDLDVLCGQSEKSSSEFEKRITATLSLLLDGLNNKSDAQSIVLGTTSKIYQIEKMLRSPQRFGKEVEIYVPSSLQRCKILTLLVNGINHSLTELEISNIAESCHGYVGADLTSLVSKAILINFKDSGGIKKVSFNDFQWALNKVKPSAMREIMVEIPNVKWHDIGGQEDLKLKLRQSIEWPLKYEKAFERLGITPPKGVLMFGPPGCSKTMIAKALATESKLNFISVKGPELFSKWVGESERAVRKIFQRARQAAPSIIFFDELDAIGGERNMSTGSNVQERVLAQLLTELDGVESLGNVTVIAATNRIDRIDPALIRPGRLDRIIYVPLPDNYTRQEILRLNLKKTKVSVDVSVEELVEKTKGFSGAEIIAVCREAALKALEENINADVVTKKHFWHAFEIVVPRTPKCLLEMYDRYLTEQQ